MYVCMLLPRARPGRPMCPACGPIAQRWEFVVLLCVNNSSIIQKTFSKMELARTASTTTQGFSGQRQNCAENRPSVRPLSFQPIPVSDVIIKQGWNFKNFIASILATALSFWVVDLSSSHVVLAG